MPKIVFLDRDGLASHIKLSEITAPAGSTVTFKEHATTTAQQTVKRLSGAQVAITNKVVIDQNVLDSCPDLKHIAVAATGYNIIDTKACRARGVSVSNIPSYATTSVPEHAIMLMLNLRRQLLPYRQHVANGEWSKSSAFCLFKEPIKDLSDSVLGIVGFGALGQATAQLAHGLGMQVIYTARSDKKSTYAQHLPLNDVLQKADVISLHCDLNDSTANLISTSQFKLMQPHAIVINTARGGIVDEGAAVHAIESGLIGGLGIDVLAQEPPKADHPLIELAKRPNVIVTPHIAWASDAAMQRLVDILVDNIQNHLQGKALNLVN